VRSARILLYAPPIERASDFTTTINEIVVGLGAA